MSSALSVLKLGGSVLRDDRTYAEAARFLQTRLALNQDERLVVIVSAQYGTTDGLLAEAQTITSDPSQLTLDLLWSTGELRSVAVLALHLQKIGVSAGPLDSATIRFLSDRGVEIPLRPSRAIDKVPNLEQVQVIVVLGRGLESSLPQKPTKTLNIQWVVPDP